MFTPLTSSPHIVPSFYHSANTRLILWGERGRGAEKNRRGNVDELASELKARRNSRSHTPQPPQLALFGHCLCNNSKSSFHKLDPWEERTDQRAANHCHPDCLLPGRARKGTVYAMCSSRRIGHEGPDVPLQCNLFSLIYAPGFALQHTLYVYLHPIVFAYDFINVKAC